MNKKFAWWEWLIVMLFIIALLAVGALLVLAGLYLGDWLMERHTIGGIVVACTSFLWLADKGEVKVPTNERDN